QPRFLPTLLRKFGLIFRCVWHGGRGSIDNPHTSVSPAPMLWNLLVHKACDRSREAGHHVQRQTLAGTAIAAGGGADGRKSSGDPLDCSLIDNVLTGPVCSHGLRQKHRKDIGGRIQTLSKM